MDYELVHYGVKGMRWGVRKKRETSDILANVQRTKAAYKRANKQYSKDFDNAYNRSIAAWSPSKKHRAANDARWEKAVNSADAANKAQAKYKDAKKARKDAINNKTRELSSKASFADKLVYNDATRKKAAKYIVDNNMSVAEATKKAQGVAWRNTAVVLAACGAVTLAQLYNR